MERITENEVSKLPSDVAFSLALMMDASAVIGEVVAKNGENIEAYNAAFEHTCRMATKAANRVLGYANTPNVDPALRSKLRRFVWSVTKSC